jgi:hypothetical protein
MLGALRLLDVAELTKPISSKFNLFFFYKMIKMILI